MSALADDDRSRWVAPELPTGSLLTAGRTGRSVKEGKLRPVATGWLIYHPKRQVSQFDGVTVYFDATKGNQDPYVWNQRFLHSYCHMTQMSPQVGDTSFWVSGDSFPAFNRLECDLVFRVQEKKPWNDRNHIERADCDSPEAYNDHYVWAPIEHPYKRRSRFTLKADPVASFQPQTSDGNLIDILPQMEASGLKLQVIRTGLKAGFSSRPMRLSNSVTDSVYQRLRATDTRLHGADLQRIRAVHPELGSPPLCSFCARPLGDFARKYFAVVCEDCDARAINADGEPPLFDSMSDRGDNPVFIDRVRCWRRYRFGGYITMRDDDWCTDILTFNDRHLRYLLGER